MCFRGPTLNLFACLYQAEFIQVLIGAKVCGFAYVHALYLCIPMALHHIWFLLRPAIPAIKNIVVVIVVRDISASPHSGDGWTPWVSNARVQMTAELAHRFLNLSRILATQHVALFYDFDTVFYVCVAVVASRIIQILELSLGSSGGEQERCCRFAIRCPCFVYTLSHSTLIIWYAFLVAIHVVHII
jgi:hypothetical protein